MQQVALLAEGVDRNTDLGADVDNAQKVALLAEGVDRNLRRCWLIADAVSSPSSQRAWIEILIVNLGDGS